MSVVVGMRDPTYGESKAVELILEAKIISYQFGGEDEKLRKEYQEKMSQAMSLLALSKVQRGSNEDA